MNRDPFGSWAIANQMNKGVGKVSLPIVETPRIVSRCCGICDGYHDECVTDMVCDECEVTGCEKCFGPRETIVH